MKDFFVRFLIAGGIMSVIDAVWLTTMAPRFYRSQIGQILLDKPNMLAAVLFYLIYFIGIVVLVVGPALDKGTWQSALGLGALLGFVAYATYDLTNMATIKGFSWTVVAVDLLWGCVLTGTVSWLTFTILNK